MIETHTSISKRILAGLFALLIVLSLVPGKTLIASAVDVSRFTFLVQHAGSPVEGATVTVNAYKAADTEKTSIFNTGDLTAANGQVAFPELDSVVSVENVIVEYTISKNGYRTVEGEVEVTSTNINTSFDVILLKEITEEFDVTGKTLTYTGEPRELVEVNGVEESKYAITYLLGSDESADVPTATAVGEYNVKVIIKSKDPNYAAKEIEVTSKIVDTVPVTVTAKTNLVYNKEVESQELVEINGLDSNDIVSYSLDNGNSWSNGIPKATNAGTYSVKVKVERVNFTPFETTVEVEIKKAQLDINNIIVTCATGLKYNGEDQQLITNVTGLEGIDKTDINWYIDSSNEAIQGYENVKGKAVGTYEIYLEVETDNYKAVSKYKVGEVKIDACAVDNAIIENLRIETADLSYKEGKQQELIESVSEIDGYTIWFILEDDIDVKPDVNASGWTDNSSDIKGELAGEYYIYVKIVKDNDNNYAPTRVEKENYFPVKAEIKKAQQSPLTFTNEDYTADGKKTFEISDVENKVYNFSATGGSSGENIVYSVESLDADIPVESTVEEIKTNDKFNGQLKIKGVGLIKVTATRPGGTNHEDVSVTYTLLIRQTKDLLELDTTSVDYVLGTKDGVVSSRQAEKKGAVDFTDVTYSFTDDYPYLSISNQLLTKGQVTVTNIKELAKAIPDSGVLEVRVKVHKAEGIFYGEATAYYTINISFDKLPELTPDQNFYEIKKDEAGKITNVNEAGWFNSEVIVTTPLVDYTIAKEVKENQDDKGVFGTFGSEVEFSDNGTHARYIYLKNTSTGGITNKIAVEYNNENLKIDTQAPTDIDIKYVTNPVGKAFETVTLGFFKPDIEIKITAKDLTSGVKEFNWTYTNAEDASKSINPTKKINGTLTLDEITDNRDGTYSATLILTADEFDKAEQYRGYIAVTAIDNAGKVSDTVTDNKKVFVVDRISPELSVSYNQPTVTTDGEDFYGSGNSDVTFTLNVTEANFYEEDVNVIVKVTDEKGVTTDISENVYLQWPDVDTDDHIGKLLQIDNDDDPNNDKPLTEDGYYEITITYKDKSTNDAIITDGDNCKGTIAKETDENGNEVNTYTKSFTIDKDAPIVSIEYDKDNQKTTFVVTEHNFTAKGVTVTGSALDSKSSPVDFDAEALTAILQKAEWTQIGNSNTYTYEYKEYINGNYKLKLTCVDKATNSTTSEEKAFTIDRGAPVVKKIEYAKTPTDEFLEKITLGFYNPSVTLKFTATDDTTAVKSFNWTYTRESGASTSILEAKSGTVEATGKDGVYTAEITLTAKEAEQYRGHITVVAVDTYGNESKPKDDKGNVFVVDTINPELSVTYTAPTVTTDGTDFYGKGNSDVTFTLNVTEANFYEEDINVTVMVKDEKGIITDISKNVYLKWSDVKKDDEHIGELLQKDNDDDPNNDKPLTEDGDYEITITYKDKSTNDAIITDGKDCKGTITTVEDESGNKTTTYTKSFTIDKTAPVISKVEFDKEVKVVSTKDNRNYYAEEQTATVTITEHNFDETGVNFIVKATDASGATITSLDRTINGKDLEWTVDANNSDKHIVTLTFEADANYTFDIECVDKATNAADYTPDEFTVDKTAPDKDSLKVTYIESKTGKVAEVLSLGYFQNKVKVIITAEDATAGVNAFTYGYENAKGVSQVNGQLLDQKLKEADVQIDGNKTTATFTIPKSALGKGTQFNGNVKFVAIDRSGNQTAKTDDNRIIVDNIAPVANVSFSDPVNTVGDISYYAGDINATITIDEANFDAKDYKVVLTKDGVVDNISTDVKWTDESVDVHKGTFTIKADGDYVVELSGADKSGNKLKNYTSKQLTIDTDIKEPTFSINGAAKSGIGGAYKGDISVSFNYEDENFDNAEIKLVKTSLNSVEDVTSKYINANNEEKGGSGSFSIPAEVANDGIYTLTVNMNDKAKHTSSAELKFTVNRYGSVYEYSDYLISLIKDGGQYVTIKDGATAAITEDIVITEYNATPILSDSLKVLITRDGEVIEADYTTTPSNLDSATIGNSGWYQYVYTIKASNFAEDGVYKISLVSQYSANDAENNESTSVPENSIDSEGNEIVDTMTFTVDTKAPEIRNITNLEKSYIDADSVEVNYSIVDVGGLKSIEVIVNGKTVAEITDFKENLFSCDGSFVLKADSKEQTVQIIVTDLAGNVTDTSSEAFDTQGLYTFNPNVTVSTNIFVLWYANTGLFWGSIGGGVGVIGVAAVSIPKIRVRLRKRK